MPQRRLLLTPSEREDLLDLRDHALQPYLRERAAALLKIADGLAVAAVARHGLLRPRRPDTLYEWLDRYQAEGMAGLILQAGRGRKPAFFPSPPDRHRDTADPATPLST